MSPWPPFPTAGAPALTVRLDAAAAADRRGVLLAPASALIHLKPGWSPRTGPGLHALAGDFTVELLTPAQADARTPPTPSTPPSARPTVLRLDLKDHVLLPGLVNAHTHLDLTDLGPLEEARGDFPRFLDHVRTRRASDEDAIAAAVTRGAELSLAGGVVAVGDIAGCPRSGPTAAPFHALAASGLAGVSFLEFFGVGDRALASVERAIGVLAGLPGGGALRPGLQPHAPYSVEPAAYRAAAAHARLTRVPVATHLAESLAEQEFIARATGPQRALLETLGLWSSRLHTQYGFGRTPIAHLAEALEGSPCLLVHCNDVSDDDLAVLASMGGPVAYCPRSSAYFEAERSFGPHRYREMQATGVPVCLGTDSILNLPRESADPSVAGISVLDEARLLWARDGGPAGALVGMMTTQGASALGLEADLYEFAAPGSVGRLQGLNAVPVGGDIGVNDPLELVLAGRGRARLLLLRNPSGLAGTG